MARKILLADDSVTAQNMGRRILTDAGYEVTTVNNGSAALKKIAEQKPDLIVLDVYMPGYGGLEVCQRLKETRETARIPVLLSVGKLEPFKADEARRVKADAYIVKPFEASELLTALTKLEDKIVPQGDQIKPGRLAKAIAVAEQGSDPGDGFGDSETGWKDRLKFPSRKPAEEREPPAPVDTKFRNLLREEGVKPVEPSRVFERPIPAGLPRDITAEEIAAITAAAASFRDKAEEAVSPASPQPEVKAASPETSEVTKPETQDPVKAEVAAVEVPASEAPAAEAPAVVEAVPAEPGATFASAPEVAVESSEPKSESAPAAAGAAIVATSTSTDAAQPAANVSDAPQADPQPQPAADATVSASVPWDQGKPWSGDADVMAALATLIPVGGNGFTSNESTQGFDSLNKNDVPLGVAMAESAAKAVGTGPRWIAEEVAIEAYETALHLEQEMEKAFAAFAAAAGARETFARIDSLAGHAREAMATPPSSAGQEAGGDAPAATVAAAESAAAAIGQVSTPAAAAGGEGQSSPEGKPEQVTGIGAVPVIAEVPAVTEAVSAIVAATATPEKASPGVEQVPEIAESAFAAAAAAGNSAAQPGPPSASVVWGGPAEPGVDVNEKQQEAEMDAATAAAWAHWRQIRESIVGSQAPEPVSEHAFDLRPQVATPASNPEAPVEVPHVAGADPSAIASIVDSVLAELKPRLMEEIAKKLGQPAKSEAKK